MDTGLLVLVIEDDPTDFEMLRRSLRRAGEFELVWARSAQEGLDELRAKSFDVIVLDLTLPDSDGMDSVRVFTDPATSPVVVLSGMDDESLALESVQHGAQDYLVKGHYDTQLMAKTLRYAAERYRLLEELHESKMLINRERELRRLEAGSYPVSEETGNADQKIQVALKKSHPKVVAFAAKYYSALLDKALEQRGFKVENKLSLQLRVLADALGTYRATPRDIVEIHTMSLSDKLDNMPVKKIRLCNEEARYLLTGLLGHLCSFYKTHSRNLPVPVPMAEGALQLKNSTSSQRD